MSDKSAQKDPSMEEILGSIRRIISEDSAQGGSSPVVGGEIEDDDDVLELTDEVSEEEPSENRREPVFGIRPAQPADSSQADEGEARREPVLGLKRIQQPAEEFEDHQAATADETMEETMAEETPPEEPAWPAAETLPEDYQAGTEDMPESAQEELVAMDESEPGDLYEEEGEQEGGYADAGYAAAEPQDVEREWPDQQEEQPMTMPSDEPAGGEDTQSTETDSGEVMSEAASDATTAALSELNRAMSEKGSRMKVGEGDVTIAEVVKDLMRPMLREWLDENLPGIVERVVKREIQKLVDRTQDDD